MGTSTYIAQNKRIINDFKSAHQLRHNPDKHEAVERILDQWLGIPQAPEYTEPPLPNLSAVNIATLIHQVSNINKDLKEDSFRYLAHHLLTIAIMVAVCPTDFKGQEIGNALYGLQNLGDSAEVRRVLAALAKKIPAIRNFKGQEIGNALYGLQNLGDSAEVRQLLAALAKKIPTIRDFKGQNIGMALYGLQNLGDSDEVKQVLAALADKIPNITDFKGQAIGNALYGLQNLGDSEEVRLVLAALAAKIPTITDFNGQNIGMALYGLQNLGDSAEVRRVLAALAAQIPTITDFNGQNIGMALYGLQNLGDSAEVRQLLAALAKKIPSVRDFKGQEIGNALYGLQNLGDSAELRQLLTALAAKIPTITDFKGQEIGNAIYGLQSMGDSAEVRQLLAALAAKIPNITDFNGQEIGNALYGLQNVGDSAEVRQLLAALAKKIPTIRDFKDQNIGMALYGLQNLGDSAEVRLVLAALAAKIPTITDFNGQNIGMALYGLQNLGDSAEVRRVLAALAAQIPTIRDFKGQAIGNALYGLQNLGDSAEVKQVLAALAAQIPTITDFKGQEIGNALYGLQSMGDSDEIKQVLAALAAKIPTITDFKGQNIGNALYGLQSMGDSDEIKQVLAALAAQIPTITDFKGQEIGNALYGLQNLGDSAEVKQVLAALAAKIPNITDFKGQEIGNALYGLQNLGDSEEVRLVLAALAAKIPSVRDFKGQEIGNALYGLQNLGDSAKTRHIICLLTDRARECGIPLDSKNMFQIIKGFQTIIQTQDGIQFASTIFEKLKSAVQATPSQKTAIAQVLAFRWLLSGACSTTAEKAIQTVAACIAPDIALNCLTTPQVTAILHAITPHIPASVCEQVLTTGQIRDSVPLNKLARFCRSPETLLSAMRTHILTRSDIGVAAFRLSAQESDHSAAFSAAVVTRIERSQHPEDLVSVQKVGDDVVLQNLVEYSQDEPVTMIYVPSRFDGTFDQSAEKLIGNILHARQKHHIQTNAPLPKLVIALGYNRKPTDLSQIDNIKGDLTRIFASKELNTTGVKIILQEYTWEGVRYPFGLMRTQLLTRLYQEYQLENNPVCNHFLRQGGLNGIQRAQPFEIPFLSLSSAERKNVFSGARPPAPPVWEAITPVCLVGLDGDVQMTSKAWKQTQDALFDTRRSGFWGSTGFMNTGKDTAERLTRDGFDLDFAVQQGLKTKKRINETCTYMTREVVRLVMDAISHGTSPYPIFDNENNHLMRALLERKVAQKSQGTPTSLQIKHYVSGSDRDRVVLRNADTFTLQSSLEIRAQNTWTREQAIAYFSTLRGQRQSFAHPRAVGQWLGMVYKVPGTTVSTIAKAFDWKRIIENTAIAPNEVNPFLQDILTAMQDQHQPFHPHFSNTLSPEIYLKITKKLCTAALSVAAFMVKKVGTGFSHPSEQISDASDYLRRVYHDEVTPAIDTHTRSSGQFNGRSGQINQVYRPNILGGPSQAPTFPASSNHGKAYGPDSDSRPKKAPRLTMSPHRLEPENRKKRGKDEAETYPIKIGRTPEVTAPTLREDSATDHAEKQKITVALKEYSKTEITAALNALESHETPPTRTVFNVRINADNEIDKPSLKQIMYGLQKKENKHISSLIDLLDEHCVETDDQPFHQKKEKLVFLLEKGGALGLITPGEPFDLGVLTIVIDEIRK